MTVTNTDNNATKYVKNINYDGYDRAIKEKNKERAKKVEVQIKYFDKKVNFSD